MPEVYGPGPIVLLDQANGFAPEGLAHVDHLPPPLDLSGAADASYRDPSSVLWRADACGIGAKRGRVESGGRSLPEGLVGPLDVVAVPEAVESPTLSSPVGLRRRSRLGLQGSVKPLQTPVLLGVSGLDPLWHYPQLDPPCGQWREASQPHTSEGRPVVGADDVGQAVLSESPIQYALNLWAGGPLQTGRTPAGNGTWRPGPSGDQCALHRRSGTSP